MSASSYDSAPTYGNGTPATSRHGSGMATAALVLGIIALVFCWTVIGGIVLGLLAIVFGIIGVRRAKAGAPGKVRAIIGIVTGALGLLIAAAVIALGVSVFNSDSVQNLQDCLQNANNNQAQVQSCNDKFQDDIGN